jgi:hypothetical protein
VCHGQIVALSPSLALIFSVKIYLSTFPAKSTPESESAMDGAGIVLGVIGLVSELIFGVIQLVPPTGDPPNGGSTIHIGVGLHELNDPDSGGDVPGIGLWDEEGGTVGHVYSRDTKIKAGTFANLYVPQSPPNSQPTYVRVEGGADSICIAYIGHTWPDGSKRGWLGDIGQLCGKQYYYSSLFVTQANGSSYTVRLSIKWTVFAILTDTISLFAHGLEALARTRTTLLR